jgi:cell division protein FtsL
MEESAPGQFNFINSQLRMNENHVENQNEFEKMSLMVKNLVSCKIEHIFNDIDRAKEDLKMRIKIAIEAAEKASTSTAILAAPPQQIINANANAAESQAKINDLHKQIEDLKKGNDLNSQSKIAELNKQLEELNKQLEELDKKPAILPVTSSDDLTKANAEIATKGVSGVTIGTNMSNTDLELAKALARNKE